MSYGLLPALSWAISTLLAALAALPQPSFGSMTRCACKGGLVINPSVFADGMQAPPVTGFTVRMSVDHYLVLNEVVIHDDAILRGERPEIGGREPAG